MVRLLSCVGLPMGTKKSGNDSLVSRSRVCGWFLDLVDFFSLAELNLWWQWHGFWYYYLPVSWKCFAQVGLDGSG